MSKRHPRRRKPAQPPQWTPWLLVAGLAAELVRLASEVLTALT